MALGKRGFKIFDNLEEGFALLSLLLDVAAASNQYIKIVIIGETAYMSKLENDQNYGSVQ